MKTLKVLITPVLTILAISVFAQNSTNKDCKSSLTKSKKEQMKMDVIKIYTCTSQTGLTSDMADKYASAGSALNLTSKELMKMDVMKFYTGPQYPDVAFDNAGTYPRGLTLINLSAKEQMKMKDTGM